MKLPKIAFLVLFLSCVAFSHARSQTLDQKTKDALLSGKWYIIMMEGGGMKMKYDESKTRKNWIDFKSDGTFTSVEDGATNQGKWITLNDHQIKTFDSDGETLIEILLDDSGKMNFKISEGGNNFTIIHFKK